MKTEASILSMKERRPSSSSSLIAAVMCCLSLVACTQQKGVDSGQAETSQKAETAQEASKAILELLKNEDYNTLFKTRYCELHKAEKEGKVDEAIKTLTGYWKKDHKTIVGLFEQLSTGEFLISKNEHAQISETGRKATCKVTLEGKTISYSLYEMKTGLWGFHM